MAEKESLQQELEQVQEALAKEKKQCDDRIKEEQAKIEQTKAQISEGLQKMKAKVASDRKQLLEAEAAKRKAAIAQAEEAVGKIKQRCTEKMAESASQFEAKELRLKEERDTLATQLATAQKSALAGGEASDVSEVVAEQVRAAEERAAQAAEQTSAAEKALDEERTRGEERTRQIEAEGEEKVAAERAEKERIAAELSSAQDRSTELEDAVAKVKQEQSEQQAEARAASEHAQERLDQQEEELEIKRSRDLAALSSSKDAQYEEMRLELEAKLAAAKREAAEAKSTKAQSKVVKRKVIGRKVEKKASTGPPEGDCLKHKRSGFGFIWPARYIKMQGTGLMIYDNKQAQEQPRGSSISNLMNCTVTSGYEDFFTSGKWCVALAVQANGRPMDSPLCRVVGSQVQDDDLSCGPRAARGSLHLQG